MAVGARKLLYFVKSAFGGNPAEPIHEPQVFNPEDEIIGEHEPEFGMLPSR